ncbi:MAG: mandelate racemase/muconate lactonizing enzyme family protein [Acidimicrobiales bacterium]|nr:mandelate racemase/muconate lactonizing enzyme family protein [Acidimicrobiales bacterium]
MNPMVSAGLRRGSVAKFEPSWGEVACVVTLDDGTWGLGLTAHAGPVVPVINDYLGPLIEQETVESVADIGELWDLMSTVGAAHLGISGVVSYAISAVDLALYDAHGRQRGVPVYELLGGPAHDSIECYATSSDVAKLADLGFDRFKIPCPWSVPSPAGIAAAVGAVEEARSRIGDADLMVDGWAVMDAGHAATLCRSLKPYDLRFVEDVVHPDDTDGYATVRASTSLRLAAGERWFGLHPFAYHAAHGTVDVLQPDALWVGGATATVRIAGLARQHGLDLAIHCAVNDSFGQHLAFALAENVIGEMYVGGALALADSYRSTPGMALPTEGRVVPVDAPGFGIEITLDGIEAASR